ncbi:MAG: FAD-dependent oxidoreductase [Bdellovibrionota bacterium]
MGRIQDIAIVGASAGGMAAALALSEKGHRVTLFEKDDGGVPPTNVEAFESWNRRGTPQLRTSHGFLARLRNILRDRAPSLYKDLLAEGAYEVPIQDLWPPTMETPPDVLPGDEDFVMLACRRVTFDWVMRRHLERRQNVEFQTGWEAMGLVVEHGSGLPRVTGLRLTGPDGAARVHPADLVIDASGRRTIVPRWLEECGVPRPREESEHCGIFICSRFYRLRPGQGEPAESRGFLAANLGYMAILLVRGDSGIFSVMTATARDDADLKAMVKPEAFERAVAAIPLFAPWTQPSRSEPLGGIKSFGDLHNTRREYLVDGKPLILGLIPVGDAFLHGNPAYGRGMTQLFMHAYLLADALENHPSDLEGLAVEMLEGAERELGRWYRQGLEADRATAVIRESFQKLGTCDPSSSEAFANPAVVLQHAMGQASRTDPVVFRAVLRSYNMLDPPAAFLKNPEVTKRIAAVAQRIAAEKYLPTDGPTREELLGLLGVAA